MVYDSADTVRWIHERGIRFRLMYERQPSWSDGADVLGRIGAGTVDGGRGLIDQHAAAAEEDGDRGPLRLAGRGLERGAVAVRRPDGTRET